MDWQVLLSTFGMLFLAELGDKTQLAVIAQTCRFRRPWAVFWGATLALAVVTALGVVAGELVSLVLPTVWVRRAAALGFLVMGAYLLWQSWKAVRQGEAVCEQDALAADCSRWRVFGATFALLALAELGDKTQLAVFAQSSQAGAPGAVFLGATLALGGVTALGVAGGQGLVRVFPERWLRRLAASAFVVVGLLIGIGTLWS